MPSVPASTPPWQLPLQLALVALASAICLFPQTHVAAVAGPFWVLACINYGATLRRDWKSGRLSSTPRQLHERARGGERLASSALELATLVACMLAMFKLT